MTPCTSVETKGWAGQLLTAQGRYEFANIRRPLRCEVRREMRAAGFSPTGASWGVAWRYSKQSPSSHVVMAKSGRVANPIGRRRIIRRAMPSRGVETENKSPKPHAPRSAFLLRSCHWGSPWSSVAPAQWVASAFPFKAIGQRQRMRPHLVAVMCGRRIKARGSARVASRRPVASRAITPRPSSVPAHPSRRHGASGRELRDVLHASRVMRIIWGRWAIDELVF